ncbi:MAG: hypothetical protein ACXABY_20890, partial [Candidatus Thorarchaeota archaeon]
MPDVLQTPVNTTLAADKLRDLLDAIATRVNDERSTEVSSALSEAMAAFNRFFNEIGDTEFSPQLLRDGDTARSEVYNENLKTIFNDISRFYSEIRNLAEAQLRGFNFSQVVTREIVKRADGLASIVLDLNILNNFTRGDVIVAGDDFRNLDNVDQGVAVASTQAELLAGGGFTLARDGVNDITGPETKIDIIPLSPASTAPGAREGLVTVNTAPTAGNIERFYEGSYYNFLGSARPEGGFFNIKYILDPT